MSTYRTLWIEAVPEKKERKKVLGQGTVSEQDHYQVDGQALARQIEEACNAADSENYDIISILPIDRGREYMGTLGYSITDGVILTARKRA